MSDQENPDSPVSGIALRRITLRNALAALNVAHGHITADYDDNIADVLDAIDAAIERVQVARHDYR